MRWHRPACRFAEPIYSPQASAACPAGKGRRPASVAQAAVPLGVAEAVAEVAVDVQPQVPARVAGAAEVPVAAEEVPV